MRFPYRFGISITLISALLTSMTFIGRDSSFAQRKVSHDEISRQQALSVVLLAFERRGHFLVPKKSFFMLAKANHAAGTATGGSIGSFFASIYEKKRANGASPARIQLLWAPLLQTPFFQSFLVGLPATLGFVIDGGMGFAYGLGGGAVVSSVLYASPLTHPSVWIRDEVLPLSLETLHDLRSFAFVQNVVFAAALYLTAFGMLPPSHVTVPGWKNWLLAHIVGLIVASVTHSIGNLFQRWIGGPAGTATTFNTEWRRAA